MREPIDPSQAAPAARRWWNQAAPQYRQEHHAFLDAHLIWGPEGWSESDLRLLGPLSGRQVLDLGCGQGQTTAWLGEQGAHVVGLDIAESMLAFGSGPRVCGDAQHLPFANDSFDLVVSAYGALPFIADLDQALREIARVTREALVFSVTHPIRWAFRDDPNALTAEHSYFDRTPYVERDSHGNVAYSEHHRTIGDWVAALVRNNFAIDELIELEWKADNQEVWGGWSPQRGRLIPGTMIISAHRKK